MPDYLFIELYINTFCSNLTRQ